MAKHREYTSVLPLRYHVVNDLEQPRSTLSGYKYGAGWATARTTNIVEKYARALSASVRNGTDNLKIPQGLNRIPSHHQKLNPPLPLKSKFAQLNSFIIDRSHVIVGYLVYYCDSRYIAI